MSLELRTVVQPVCSNGTGSIALTGSGGKGALTYLVCIYFQFCWLFIIYLQFPKWSGVENSRDRTGLPVGGHEIRAQDSNGCLSNLISQSIDAYPGIFLHIIKKIHFNYSID